MNGEVKRGMAPGAKMVMVKLAEGSAKPVEWMNLMIWNGTGGQSANIVRGFVLGRGLEFFAQWGYQRHGVQLYRS